MYFWNVKALAKDLKNNLVSESDKMKYLLGMNLLTFILIGANQLSNIILNIQISTPELNRLIGDIRRFFKVPVKHRGILYLRILQEDLVFWVIKAFFVILLFGAVIWGIYYCFAINKAGDNKSFIQRMVCLSFPIAIRMSLLGVGITGILIYVLPELLAFLDMAFALQLILEELVPLFAVFLILIFMYKAIGIQLKYISRP
ncbi:MAG: hypothetical protein WD068_02205 [Candidatus Babeliales bacterium]